MHANVTVLKERNASFIDQKFGDLVPGRGVDAKLNRFIIRGLYAQLLANAQVVAENKKQKERSCTRSLWCLEDNVS